MENTPLLSSHLKASFSSSSKHQKLQKSLPKSRRSSKDSSLFHSNQDQEIRLTDLCAEDKARIGELVKRLALEKSQREETESKFELEKKQKAKQLKTLAKENEKIKAETKELKSKYEKSLEILETYKQNDFLKNSWKEWEAPGQSRLESRQNIKETRATPDPVTLSNMPISPMREISSIGVQTVCDKEVQTSEEPGLKSAKLFQSEAVKEIKNLKDDLFFLSESVRNCNITSLRASQNLLGKKDAEGNNRKVDMDFEDERIRKFNKPSEASKRSEENRLNLIPEDLGIGKKTSLDIFEASFNDFEKPKNLSPQFSYKNDTYRHEIERGFYNENLFQLVDDLECMESDNYEFPDCRAEQFSDFSEQSRKEKSIDSLEELRNRALRLKNTLKY